MNNELSNAIETISTCAESVSELSTALDKYLSSFERIQKTVSDIQKHEESTADILDTVSLQISEQIEKTQNWAEEVVPEAVRTLTDLSARTVELTEGTGKELEKSLSILTSAVDELGPIVKEMDGISAALHSVSEKTAELPQLSKVSKEIHNSLGILSGLDELVVISEKLDSKIAAIELEKKELVEPLKNAAKFTEVVKAENKEIHGKIDAVNSTLSRENESMQELLATFSMKEPDSFAAKMDYLVTAIGIEEVNLDGFQIVRSEMFLHFPRKGEATCTVWPTKISFSKLALTSLNSCEYVRIEINPNTKCLLVVPVTSKDKDSIRWIKGQKEFTVRNMESKQFGDILYSTWGLNPQCNYRAAGRLISSKGKVMLLFNFTDAEMWKGKKAGKDSE